MQRLTFTRWRASPDAEEGFTFDWAEGDLKFSLLLNRSQAADICAAMVPILLEPSDLHPPVVHPEAGGA